MPDVSRASWLKNYYVSLRSKFSKNFEKSLDKPSPIFEKIMKSRVCQNRFKLALLKGQTEFIPESGGILPLSSLIIEKFHIQKYR